MKFRLPWPGLTHHAKFHGQLWSWVPCEVACSRPPAQTASASVPPAPPESGDEQSVPVSNKSTGQYPPPFTKLTRSLPMSCMVSCGTGLQLNVTFFLLALPAPPGSGNAHVLWNTGECTSWPPSFMKRTTWVTPPSVSYMILQWLCWNIFEISVTSIRWQKWFMETSHSHCNWSDIWSSILLPQLY